MKTDENCDECGATLQHIEGDGFRCPNPGCIRK